MQYPRRCLSGAIIAIALGSLRCAPAEDPSVTYGAGAPVDETGSAGTRQVSVAGSGGSVTLVGGTLSMAGSGGTSAAGRGGSSAAGGAGAGAGSVAVAGSGGTLSVNGLSSMSFDVTPLSQGGRYSPKNIGAIWVQNSSGAFVKSLEVWARQRRQYLTKYNAAVGTTSSSVDVTTTATQTSLKAHHVTWNLHDKSGAAVSPGTYTVWIEVTDYDGTGKSYSVSFDLAAGSLTMTPASVQYYNAMALQLQ